jgi:hypothetical protein
MHTTIQTLSIAPLYRERSPVDLIVSGCTAGYTDFAFKPTLPGEDMNRVPDSELVHIPGGSLLTATPEQGRALALAIARHTIHNIQPDLDVLKAGRPNYAANPESLIAASQVVAIEFQTIAAANDYWRRT